VTGVMAVTRRRPGVRQGRAMGRGTERSCRRHQMRIGTLSLWGLLVATTAMPAWAQPTAAEGSTPARQASPGARERGEPPGPMDLLPLLAVERVSPPDESESAVGGYVRFWVQRGETGGDRDY